jgi:hypothetical protein
LRNGAIAAIIQAGFTLALKLLLYSLVLGLKVLCAGLSRSSSLISLSRRLVSAASS